MNSDIPLSEIIEARDKVARIIAKYGKRYLPIFERLDFEVEKRKKEEELLKKAIDIGTQNDTQSGTHFKSK